MAQFSSKYTAPNLKYLAYTYMCMCMCDGMQNSLYAFGLKKWALNNWFYFKRDVYAIILLNIH